MPTFIPPKAKPFIEGLAVGCVFVSITLLFELPLYISFIIGVLTALGGYRNSLKMDQKKAAKKTKTTSKEPD